MKHRLFSLVIAASVMLALAAPAIAGTYGSARWCGAGC